MDILPQIFSTFSLILGIAAGEIISTRAFGTFKKSWLYVIEVCIFVATIVTVFSLFQITITSLPLIVIVYSLIGSVLIIAIHGVITVAGFFSQKVVETAVVSKDTTDYAIGIKRALQRRGFSREEIRKVSKEAGLPKEAIDNSLGPEQ